MSGSSKNNHSQSERREFPRVEVWTKLKVMLRHQRSFLIGEIGNVSAGGIYVLADDCYTTGSIVDFEFTLLDEVRPYIGRAEVIRVDRPDQYNRRPCGIALRFVRVRIKPMSLRDMARQIVFLREVSLDIAVDALRYAWAELQGNVTSRELGQPGVGFLRPVLLIHGWLGTRGALSIIERRLKKDGFPVFSINLGSPNVKDIAASAKQVTAKVERLSERLGIQQVDVVAHSMGGLIGLWAMKKNGLADYIRRFIAVGSPFHGTLLAAAGLPLFGLWGKSLWQMLPGSSFIRQLHEGPLPPKVELYSIAARHDGIVPLKSAALAGATNLMIERGHASLVVSQSAYKRIHAILTGKDPFAVS